ncbi:MAG: hypothetical protein ABI877_11460 [Gemmatimonadaceae bacterium]
MIRFVIGALAAALVFPSSPTNPVTTTVVGPPWISIEYPVNPYDQTTRDAFLLVHAFHHGTPTDFPVSGTAEGLVNGQRRSVSLEFTKTSRPGAFGLKKQWPTDGVWTLVVSVSQGKDDAIYAIVDLSASGTVASVRVPTREEKGWVLPAKLAMSEVDASLRARARGN